MSMTAGLVLDRAPYGELPQQLQFVRDLVPLLKRIPGVEDVAITSALPSSGGRSTAIHVQGEPASPTMDQRSAIEVQVTPGYFGVAGIPLLRGRAFAASRPGSSARSSHRSANHAPIPRRRP